MNFDLNEEQAMLQDSVRRFVDKSYGFDVRLRRANEEGGFSRATWNSFAELGWLGAGVPEEFDGLGYSMVENAIIAEELGRGLVLEPFVLCGVLPANLIMHCAAEAQKAALLPALATGETLFAAALSERNARGNPAWVEASATARDGGGYTLNGCKTLVVGAPVADKLLITARTAGDKGSEQGISLFVIESNTPGVRLVSHRLLDGTPAADLVFDNAVVPADALLGSEGTAFDGLQHAVDSTVVALCAELVGDMEDAIALSAEYLKTRKQFGVAIGSFQALQHRMADMAMELSQARATLHIGLLALAADDPANRSVEISGCKAQVARSARFVTAQGIQLHGGYGITEEYKVGHHFRRLLILDALFGDSQYHLNRYARHLQSRARQLAGGV